MTAALPAPSWEIGPRGLQWPWCDYGCPLLSLCAPPRCRASGLPTEPDDSSWRVRSLCVPALQAHHLEAEVEPGPRCCTRCKFVVGPASGACQVCGGTETFGVQGGGSVVDGAGGRG